MTEPDRLDPLTFAGCLADLASSGRWQPQNGPTSGVSLRWEDATGHRVDVTGAHEAGVTRDLSPGEAAHQTNLSRSLIYREIERGNLRAYRVGGRLRITTEALGEWKRLHAVVPRTQSPPYAPRAAVSRRSPDSFAAELRAIREGSPW